MQTANGETRSGGPALPTPTGPLGLGGPSLLQAFLQVDERQWEDSSQGQEVVRSGGTDLGIGWRLPGSVESARGKTLETPEGRGLPTVPSGLQSGGNWEHLRLEEPGQGLRYRVGFFLCLCVIRGPQMLPPSCVVGPAGTTELQHPTNLCESRLFTSRSPAVPLSPRRSPSACRPGYRTPSWVLTQSSLCLAWFASTADHIKASSVRPSAPLKFR